MAGQSFERFYYRNVAISEGCGCAEQIIASRNLAERAEQDLPPPKLSRFRPSRLSRFTAFLRRLAGRP